ncbi:MAG: hemerythrin domain-containing protein [Gemmatimonadota bacterium]|nr:hemerythrin domain-containing protein [Gemmatimonadota bacterium]MDH3424408.1 hemerythrin domain-containing protein [Gemmatimonadota bacterium]
MRWSEQYATGIARLDDQHKMIFKMADDFRASLDEGEGGTYGILLDILDAYCRRHFGFEEHCMEEYRCPVARRNREAHTGFVEVLSGFRQRYELNGYDPIESRNLVDTVDRWLSEHICRLDVHLKQCVREP